MKKEKTQEKFYIGPDIILRAIINPKDNSRTIEMIESGKASTSLFAIFQALLSIEEGDDFDVASFNKIFTNAEVQMIEEFEPLFKEITEERKTKLRENALLPETEI